MVADAACTTKYAMPTVVGPLSVLTAVLTPLHSLPPLKTTWFILSSLDSKRPSCAFRLCPSGKGPGRCRTFGGKPYTSLGTITLLSCTAGFGPARLEVFVSAQRAIRLSNPPVNSSADRAYSVPPLAVDHSLATGDVAGWTV